jgi:hypothetical protein
VEQGAAPERAATAQHGESWQLKKAAKRRPHSMININVAAISIRKLTTVAPTQNFSKAATARPKRQP